MKTTATTTILYRTENVRAHWLMDVLGIAALMALSALIRVPLPFTPVPVTFQTFIALAAGFAVGPMRGSVGILLYVVLGWIGAPLFAVSSGATFGYLFGFVLAPYLATGIRPRFLGLFASDVLIFTLGVSWLRWWFGIDPWSAVCLGVLPFLPGECMKLWAAYWLAGYIDQKPRDIH